MTKNRCFGTGCPAYELYHDTEWGIPLFDDQRLFELLILEGAQAGLSWKTVLLKREGYRRAFFNFDPEKVAAMKDAELEQLLQNPEIIRNRAKVYSARKNAMAFLQIQQEKGGFAQFLWSFVGGSPKVNQWEHAEQLPCKTEESEQLSSALRSYGMNFVGPVIAYSYMQAAGLVDDHLLSCWKRR